MLVLTNQKIFIYKKILRPDIFLESNLDLKNEFLMPIGLKDAKKSNS
jgi:hypothetical protein